MGSNLVRKPISLPPRDYQPEFNAMTPMSSSSTYCSGNLTDGLFEENETVEVRPQKIAVDEFAQANIADLNEQMSKILIAKETFLKQYADINNEIERKIRIMVYLLQEQERELITQLQEMGRIKIFSWDQQLMACAEGIRCLERGSMKEGNAKEKWGRLKSALDFIDVGGLSFELRSPILKNLGRLTCRQEIVSLGRKSNRAITSVPKFIISGKKMGWFFRLWGVCTDPQGRILVSDRQSNKIQVFNEKGGFLFQFGEEGAEEGKLCRPAGIAADKNCRIFVADKDNHRIQVFTHDGKFFFGFGKFGGKAGEFVYPWGVDINKNSEIAVADSKNWRVQLFDKHGVYLLHMNLDLGCSLPRDLAFKPDGSLLVTDFFYNKILTISKNFKTVTAFGKEGTKPREFLRPQGIACDHKGRFAVADSRNNRIQVFDEKGKLITIFGGGGRNPGSLFCPQGIAFHPNGKLIVADLGNRRIQVFLGGMNARTSGFDITGERQDAGGQEIRNRRNRKEHTKRKRDLRSQVLEGSEDAAEEPVDAGLRHVTTPPERKYVVILGRNNRDRNEGVLAGLSGRIENSIQLGAEEFSGGTKNVAT